MWDYVEGKGIWQRYRNKVTGQDSIEEHNPRVVKTWCKQHRINPHIPGNRQVVCLDCGQEFIFVVGYHDLKDGYVVTREAPKP